MGALPSLLSFTTEGYTNLKLRFWYRITTGGSISVAVKQDGAWTGELAEVGREALGGAKVEAQVVGEALPVPRSELDLDLGLPLIVDADDLADGAGGRPDDSLGNASQRPDR